MTQPKDWYNFQEELCKYFISLGLNAKTNVTAKGVRTEHDIDVLVKSKFIGHDIKWIVEAKHWSKKISKLHVLALRTIVDDIGADKGFIISKLGFQKGAKEAAENSNILLLTFEELKAASKNYVEDEIMAQCEERIALTKARYWSHSKDVRIDYKLRHDYLPDQYSIPFVLQATDWAINQAKNREYPVNLDTYLKEKHGSQSADNFVQLVNWIHHNFNVIDRKILEAEHKMLLDGRFNPDLKFHRKEDQF
jgi:hypothetical protein